MSWHFLTEKIFLNSADPMETHFAMATLGFLDGQTINLSLLAKNPEIQARLRRGERFSQEEIFDFYHDIVKEIAKIIPNSPIFIAVPADVKTTEDELFRQGKAMSRWVKNAYITLPLTKAGLRAAEKLVQEWVKVNITPCFSQEQAAAVYCATKGASKQEKVFVSPFVGRLDLSGKNGMDVVANILRMYRRGDHHVGVIAADIRSVDHFVRAIELGVDAVTASLAVLREWHELGEPVTATGKNISVSRPISYENISLAKPLGIYNIDHRLTTAVVRECANNLESLFNLA